MVTLKKSIQLFLLLICLTGYSQQKISEGKQVLGSKTTPVFTESLEKTNLESKILASLRASHKQVRFENNGGQWDKKYLFKALVPQAGVYFTPEGVLFDVVKTDSAQKAAYNKALQEQAAQARLAAEKHDKAFTPKPLPTVEEQHYAWRMAFVGADRTVQPKARHENTQMGVTNYLGFDGGKNYATKQFGELWYENLYANTDLRFYGSKDGELEYDFVVKPGADPSQLKFKLEGIEKQSINEKGELVFKTPMGDFEKGKPYAYQMVDGKETAVAVAYQQFEDGSVGYQLGNYDVTEPLIIDPIVMKWSQLIDDISNTGFESVGSMELDAAGNIYVAGWAAYTLNTPPSTTLGGNNPIIKPSVAPATASGYIFVRKYNPNGNVVLYTSILKAYGYADGYLYRENFDLTVTPDGKATVFTPTYHANATNTGTNPNINDFNYTTPGALQPIPLDPTKNGIWVGQLQSDGSAFSWATYITGKSQLTAGYVPVSRTRNLRSDDQGNIFFVFCSHLTDLPITPSAFQPQLNGIDDLYIASFSNTGALRWSTYLGGGGEEDTPNMAITPAGDIYVNCWTTSLPLNTTILYPTTPGAYRQSSEITSSSSIATSKFSNTGIFLASTVGIGVGVGPMAANNSDLYTVNGVKLRVQDNPTLSPSYQVTQMDQDSSVFFTTAIKVAGDLSAIKFQKIVSAMGQFTFITNQSYNPAQIDVDKDGNFAIFSGTMNMYVNNPTKDGTPHPATFISENAFQKKHYGKKKASYAFHLGVFDKDGNGIYGTLLSRIDGNYTNTTFPGGGVNNDFNGRVKISGAVIYISQGG